MRNPGLDTSPRSRFDRLILSNIVEWSTQPSQPLPGVTPPADGVRFAVEEMGLYWSGDRKIVVTRHPLDETHVADVSAILGYEDTTCLASPAPVPGRSVAADLAADEHALAGVIERLDDGAADGPVAVEAFGATPEYAQLVGIIRQRTRRPVTDRMTSAEHLDVARGLDSKLQCREYFQAALPQCAALRLTRAVTVRRGSDLLALLPEALQALGPVLVKTEFGAGGNAMGVIKRARSLRKAVSRILPAGYDGDLLIEEYLGTGQDALSVSYNGMVQEDGTTVPLCTGRLSLHAGQFYMGSVVGAGSMPEDCDAKARIAGAAIGAVAASFGYRGPLSVDFVYRASDGVLFPLEINPRRTLSGTLAEMCLSLFGEGYEKAVSAVALHSVTVHPLVTSYATLRDVLLRKGWFGRETSGLVVLPYQVGSLAAGSGIGLAVMGTDGTSAEAASTEITSYLERRPGK